MSMPDAASLARSTVRVDDLTGGSWEFSPGPFLHHKVHSDESFRRQWTRVVVAAVALGHVCVS